MDLSRRKRTIIGFIAGLLAGVFGKKQGKPAGKDLKDAEFSSSAQRLGVRFTERIRDVFRFKWIK